MIHIERWFGRDDYGLPGERESMWQMMLDSFPEDERPTREQLFDDILNNHVVLVARDIQPMENKVVGFLVLSSWKGQPYIWIMVVDKNYRRQKIGTRLAATVMKWYQTRPLFLHVKVSNVDAQKFYAKLGFVVSSHAPNHYPNEDGLLMRRMP